MRLKSLVAATLLALGGYAFAQDGEQTIALLPEGAELPDVVTAAIDLPKDADGEYRPSARAIESSAHGIATANAAREDGRAFGQRMAAQAKEDRELRARGERPDFADLPDQVPDHVSLPTLPERPELPELPDQVPDDVSLPTLPERPQLPELPDHPIGPPERP